MKCRRLNKIMNPTPVIDSLTVEFVDPRSTKATPAKIRRRCDNCNKKRRGCDKKDPCSGCRHLKISCTYSSTVPERKPPTENGDGSRPAKRHKKLAGIRGKSDDFCMYD